jgi:ribosomal-protein-alanine N-acetyltransferase
MAKQKILERPSARRREEFLRAAKRSKTMHDRWVSAPTTPARFDAYLRRTRRKTCLGYWVVTEQGDLAGVITISEIVRGPFCSGYLGYYAFSPHNRKGHMTRGLAAVVSDAFKIQGLHRLEANIQPDNHVSRAVVRKLGFRLEGLSPRYLRIAGRWRDHERWAITAEDWRTR